MRLAKTPSNWSPNSYSYELLDCTFPKDDVRRLVELAKLRFLAQRVIQILSDDNSALTTPAPCPRQGAR